MPRSDPRSFAANPDREKKPDSFPSPVSLTIEGILIAREKA